jgi:hypothetical protein
MMVTENAESRNRKKQQTKHIEKSVFSFILKFLKKLKERLSENFPLEVLEILPSRSLCR